MFGGTITKSPGTSRQKEVVDALGGSIKENSLVVVEGEADTGKSVICQYLAHNTVTKGKSLVYFTIDHTPESLNRQMKSLDMDVTPAIKGQRLLVKEIKPAMDYNSSVISLHQMLMTIVRLPLWFKYVIIDSPSSYLLRLKTVMQMDFLQRVRELCTNTRSIIVVLNTEVMDPKSLPRAHLMSDYYLKLATQNKVALTGQLDHHEVKALEVTKINGAEQRGSLPIRFEIIPEVGIQLLPFYHIKV